MCEFKTIGISMNICDEIKVATIATDGTILAIKALIASHSDLKFDKVSRTIKVKKSARHVQGSTFWSRTRK